LFQKDFTDDPTLGFVDSGIIFVIHSPMTVPQFDGLGLSSPVGTHARVTIRQVKVNKYKKVNIGWIGSLGLAYVHNCI